MALVGAARVQLDQSQHMISSLARHVLKGNMKMNNRVEYVDIVSRTQPSTIAEPDVSLVQAELFQIAQQIIPVKIFFRG